jgi:uncharacterized protein YifN (PemK superfamily)
MPLNIHPAIGSILICDFCPGFVAPEMVKRRCVVVVSPRFRNREGLCTVVPLSTTPPSPVEPYHMKLCFDPPLPSPYDSDYKWVKGDMLYTVSFGRLGFPFIGKDGDGKRQYDKRIVSKEELSAIQQCLLAGLGISILTK